MTWVTRARVIPSRRAISAWFAGVCISAHTDSRGFDPPTSSAIARQPLSAVRSSTPAAAPEVPASWTCAPQETDRVDPGPHRHERYTDDPASHHDIASSPRPARPRPLETDRLRPIGRTVPFRDVTAITSRPFRRPSPSRSPTVLKKPLLDERCADIRDPGPQTESRFPVYGVGKNGTDSTAPGWGSGQTPGPGTPIAPFRSPFVTISY